MLEALLLAQVENPVEHSELFSGAKVLLVKLDLQNTPVICWLKQYFEPEERVVNEFQSRIGKEGKSLIPFQVGAASCGNKDIGVSEYPDQVRPRRSGHLARGVFALTRAVLDRLGPFARGSEAAFARATTSLRVFSDDLYPGEVPTVDLA